MIKQLKIKKVKRLIKWLQLLIYEINLYSIAEFAIILATIALSMNSWSDFVETVRFASTRHPDPINTTSRFGGSVTVLLDMLTMLRRMLKVGNASVPKIGLGSRIVQDLCLPLQNSNRNITMDNFLCVPPAEVLLTQRLTLVGTMKCNKPLLPLGFLKNRETKGLLLSVWVQ